MKDAFVIAGLILMLVATLGTPWKGLKEVDTLAIAGWTPSCNAGNSLEGIERLFLSVRPSPAGVATLGTPWKGLKGMGSSLGTLRRGVNSLSRDGETLTHGVRLEAESEERHATSTDERGSQPRHPIGRRGLTWILSGITGCGIMLWALTLLARGYRRSAWLLLGLASLSVVSCGTLFWLALFPWSWGWWW